MGVRAHFDLRELRQLERSLQLAGRDAPRIMRFAMTDAGRAAQREAKASNQPLGDYRLGRKISGRITGRSAGNLTYVIRAAGPGASGLASWVRPSQTARGGRPKSPIVARGAFRGQTYTPAGAFAVPRFGRQVFRRKDQSDPDSGIMRLTGPGRAITFRSSEVFNAAVEAFSPRFYESAYAGLSRALR